MSTTTTKPNKKQLRLAKQAARTAAEAAAAKELKRQARKAGATAKPAKARKPDTTTAAGQAEFIATHPAARETTEQVADRVLPTAPAARPPVGKPRALRLLKPGTFFTFPEAEAGRGEVGEVIEVVEDGDVKVKFLWVPAGSSHDTNKPLWVGGTTFVSPGPRDTLLAGKATAGKAPAGEKPTAKAVAVVSAAGLPADLQAAVACTEGKKGGMRYTIFGVPASAILRWMGAEGWTYKEAEYAVKKLGLQVQGPTFKAQVHSGRKSGHGAEGHHGTPPELDKKQAKLLDTLVEDMPEGDAGAAE